MVAPAAAIQAGMEGQKAVNNVIGGIVNLVDPAPTSQELIGDAAKETANDSAFLKRFQELANPDSARSGAYYFGGSRDFGLNKAAEFQAKARQSANFQSTKANLAADRSLTGQQFAVLNSLRDRYTGAAPSVAEIQAMSALGANTRNVQASAGADPRNLMAQRAAMIQAARAGVNIGSTMAGQRANESFQAMSQTGGLTNNMANMAVRNGLRQAQMDLDARKFGDGLSTEYYRMGQEAVDLSLRGQQKRIGGLVEAAGQRADEVQGRAETKVAIEANKSPLEKVWDWTGL